MTYVPQHGPGWYEEPAMPGTLRYWDGQQFTGAIAPKPPPQDPGPSVATIALGVASGIALVLFMLFWFGGGFK